MEGKKKRGRKPSDVEPAYLTTYEATKRAPGTEERQIARMCLKGQRLKAKYKQGKIPANEAEKALFGKKVGKYWYVPVAELDRIFLP